MEGDILNDIDPILTDLDTIYHYTNTPVALEKILYNKKLKFSLLSQTNDPYEYRPKGIPLHWWGKDKKGLDIGAELENYIKDNFRFLSFCKNKIFKDNNKDQLGFCRPRMWSQYGEDNFEICLAFSLSALENNIKSQIKKQFYSKSVEYKKLPILDSSIAFKVNNVKNKDKEIQAFIKENMKDLLFSKHKDYRDENEHRIIIFDPKHTEIFININESIKAIVLGDRFPEVYISTIKEIAKNLNIIVKKLVWNNGKILLITK
jgi:hypothetical protein